MPDSLFFTPGRMVACLMTEMGRASRHVNDALSPLLASSGVRSFHLDIGFADESIGLVGSPRALETLFQLLYLDLPLRCSIRPHCLAGRAPPSMKPTTCPSTTR